MSSPSWTAPDDRPRAPWAARRHPREISLECSRSPKTRTVGRNIPACQLFSIGLPCNSPTDRKRSTHARCNEPRPSQLEPHANAESPRPPGRSSRCRSAARRADRRRGFIQDTVRLASDRRRVCNHDRAVDRLRVFTAYRIAEDSVALPRRAAPGNRGRPSAPEDSMRRAGVFCRRGCADHLGISIDSSAARRPGRHCHRGRCRLVRRRAGLRHAAVARRRTASGGSGVGPRPCDGHCAACCRHRSAFLRRAFPWPPPAAQCCWFRCSLHARCRQALSAR